MYNIESYCIFNRRMLLNARLLWQEVIMVHT